ncbi:Gamma-glutamyltranspeptidase @ Glutathione hydrolase [hydrothermal vent metagenome]|uniref:Gamma-glutamyltranspeptidase @ Glutathione hydrolase n=1 Tax=hydrothermal vent metagenome TaxID=652676 RepID=A0A3B0U5U3_9ZZZZ
MCSAARKTQSASFQPNVFGEECGTYCVYPLTSIVESLLGAPLTQGRLRAHKATMRKFTTRPELIGTFGVVASTHWLASQSAMAMLELGGNAFDAAVAGAFTLQVCEPHLNGPLGDAPILLRAARDTEVRVLCGQGPAPMAASVEIFSDLGVDLVPESGLLPAVVPGAFDAWMTLLADYGTMDIQTVLAPAIHYAQGGIPVVHQIHEAIGANAAMFRAHWKTSQAVYLPGGEVPEIGALLKNPALAAMLRRLVGEAETVRGREAGIQAVRRMWAQGFVAEAIDGFCRSQEVVDETGRAFGGLLTGADMARWSAAYEAPVAIDYGGYDIHKCGPWSQGPVLLQTLRLLEGAGIADMDPQGAEFVHVVTEAMKLAYADRETYYGDPNAVSVPLERLMSRDYAEARRRLIGEMASTEFRPGEMEGHPWRVDYNAAVARQPLAEAQAERGGGEPTMRRSGSRKGPPSGDTCHINVIDGQGNFVSATPSGGWLTSSPVIPQLGVPLGTRLQMAWLDAKAPSGLRPGFRPRTTLTPTIVTRDDGTPYLNLGTPGGESQDQWQLIFLLRHLHHGMNLAEAIDAPSFHSEHWPNSFAPRQARPAYIRLEGQFSDDVVADLRRRGHDVDHGEPWSEGRLSATAREADGRLRAAANPRGMQGYAVGR